MDFFQLVVKRRSIRSYESRKVPDQLLEKILDAAHLAPSAVNLQPWRFIVLQKEDERALVQEAYSRAWFTMAPCVIVVCCDHEKSWKRADGVDFGEIDCAIAMDHITLAAAHEGLGTCWIGAFDQGILSKNLRLPPAVQPVVLTPLGFPKGPLPAAKEREPLERIVQYGLP